MTEAVKVGRSVRLTPEVNRRLLALCGHLGVTPNAYIVGEIGKAVARDELSFSAKQRSDSLFDSLETMVRESAQSD